MEMIMQIFKEDAELQALLRTVLEGICSDFTDEAYSLELLEEKFRSFARPGMEEPELWAALVKAAVELTSAQSPKWELIAARLLGASFRRELSGRLKVLGITDFYSKLCYLTEEKLYGKYILEHYTKEEIQEAETFLCPERNHLFTYSGLDLLLKRYVIRSRRQEPLETPQEMFLGISLHLAMEEKKDRLYWVRKFYDMLSRMYVTMATPTLSNARKPYHQLSSCFIDTVSDSLEGIYRSSDNFARVNAKFSGNADCISEGTRRKHRGFEGAAGGVIRWIRLVNDTAVAVDQLGMRGGRTAVYLECALLRGDLPEFLQLPAPAGSGDQTREAHDVTRLWPSGWILETGKGKFGCSLASVLPP